MAMTFFVVAMASPARSETVLSVPAPDSMPTTGSWRGYSSPQAVCDHFRPGHAYNPSSEYGGQCGTDYIFFVSYTQTCPAGYYFHYSTAYPIQETCYKKGAPNRCPAVAAGETSFTLDPGGLTCSRPDKEKLTITLSGGTTTEPWHKKHDKEHLKANLPFKAIVTQNGQPKENFAVTITTDVTSDSGGHVHTNGRPKGKLVDQVGSTVKTKDGKSSIPGNTNGSGIFEFTFGAEEASGTHTITANCTGCKEPAKATVDVGIQGLMQLDADPSGYTLTGDKPEHPDNHYFSPAATVNIINFTLAYKRKFHNPLIINDSSLVKGGVYDLQQDWTHKSNKHGGHRMGVVVDINNYTINPTPPREQFPDPDFEDFAATFGIQADPHPDPNGKHPMGTAPHYHLLLLGAGHDQ